MNVPDRTLQHTFAQRPVPPLVGLGAWSRLMQLVRRPGSQLDPSRRDRLRSASARLEDLCRTSEEDFLHLGSKLAQFFRQAQEIQKSGRSAADLLGGAEVTATIGRLDTVLQQVEVQLETGRDQVDQVAATLTEVSAILRTASAPLRGIGNCVTSLRMLSTTTRAESARLAQSAGGFEHLTVEVSRHSGEIGERLEDMRAQMAELGGRVNGALQRVARFRSAQADDLGRVIARVQEAVTQLQRKQAGQRDAVAQIARRSEQVVQAVGEVVASLQYHDITRQQMEHVRDALVSRLASTERVHLPSFFGLQASQLVSARDDLAAALEHAFDSLRSGGGMVREMAQQMDAVNGADGGRCGDLLQTLGRRFMEAIAGLQGYGEMMAEVSGLLDELTASLSAMVRFSAGVEGIGYDIRLIALNTAVKAAGLGPAGAALDVVSSLVGGISREVMAQATGFNAALRQIECSAEQLQGHTRMGTDGTERIGSVQTELEESLKRIDGLVGRAMDQFADMDVASRTLGEEIETLVGGLDTNAMAQREIGTVLGLLCQAARVPSVQALLLSRPQGVDRALAHLSTGYTTGGERKTHQAWMENRGPARGVPTAIAGLPASAGDPSQGELGDNVELF